MFKFPRAIFNVNGALNLTVSPSELIAIKKKSSGHILKLEFTSSTHPQHTMGSQRSVCGWRSSVSEASEVSSSIKGSGQVTNCMEAEGGMLETVLAPEEVAAGGEAC
jgi:hypothetical protein